MNYNPEEKQEDIQSQVPQIEKNNLVLIDNNPREQEKHEHDHELQEN